MERAPGPRRRWLDAMAALSESPIQAAKRDLRRDVLARRAALTPGERAQASRRILDALLRMDEFQAASGVHAFVSFPEEVDTAPIVAACRASGKDVFLPYQLPDRGRLGCARWNPGSALVPGPFGTKEPAPESRGAVDLGAFGLVLVPGVAFDRKGGRLGYGRGYYDRFLSELRAGGHRPALVALAFACQVVPEVPRDPWDVSIPALLTEEELLRR